MRNLEEVRAAVAQASASVREQNPMAGSITNTVTIDFVANAQLAVGGSAAMVYMPDEGETLVAAGGAVYINVGTIFPIYEQSLPRTAKAACEAGKPWVLDPVAIGIGSLRTSILAGFKDTPPAIVRGNASEVIALAKLWGVDVDGADAQDGAQGAGQTDGPRGVDTTDEVEAARGAAVALARFTGGAVAVSGEVDLVTDGHTVAYSSGGSALAGKVTGFGCSLGGVAAVYACVADPFTAALAAVAHYNLAGTRAAAKASAPASFKVAFIDALYEAAPADIAANPLSLEEA